MPVTSTTKFWRGWGNDTIGNTKGLKYMLLMSLNCAYRSSYPLNCGLQTGFTATVSGFTSPHHFFKMFKHVHARHYICSWKVFRHEKVPHKYLIRVRDTLGKRWSWLQLPISYSKEHVYFTVWDVKRSPCQNKWTKEIYFQYTWLT